MAIKCAKDEFFKDKLCLVFASDSQASGTILKGTSIKIRGVFDLNIQNSWGILIASSGNDTAVIDEVCYDLSNFLLDKIDINHKHPSLALLNLRKEIGDIAYTTYKKYKDRCERDPHFELLMGACDDFSTILNVNCEGKTLLLDDYALIGIGRLTGGELLLKEFYKEDLSVHEASLLSALIISRVSDVDMYVGGNPYFGLCRDRKIFEPPDETYKQYLKDSQISWNATRQILWKLFSSISKEENRDNLNEKIKKFLEN